MRQTLLALALLSATAATANPLPDANALADQVGANVLTWRRDLHQFPELGNREFETSRKVAEHLRALGMEVQTGVAHTGVVGILRGGKPGKRIALRADMDALPVTERSGLPFESQATTEYRGEKVGVMHACGHDAHTSILMGVAQALASVREDLPGEVMFIFQPAEEGPPDGEEGGAELMLKQGLFKDFKPEAVFGLHVFSTLNVGKLGYRGGPTMAASDRFRIVVKGRQAHGSSPWMGVDPIVAAADIVSTAQTIVSRRNDISRLPVVVTFGTFKGGVRYNIIPEEVELLGTIRTFDSGMREQVNQQLRDIATHVAAAHGATVQAEVPSETGYPVTANDQALSEQMRPSLIKAAGEGNVVAMPLVMGSEDFSLYANEVPGLFFFVGSTPADQDPRQAPSNHSPEFFLDEGALPLGTRALLQLSLDYLQHP